MANGEWWKLLHPSENLQKRRRLFPRHEEKITWKKSGRRVGATWSKIKIYTLNQPLGIYPKFWGYTQDLSQILNIEFPSSKHRVFQRPTWCQLLMPQGLPPGDAWHDMGVWGGKVGQWLVKLVKNVSFILWEFLRSFQIFNKTSQVVIIQFRIRVFCLERLFSDQPISYSL